MSRQLNSTLDAEANDIALGRSAAGLLRALSPILADREQTLLHALTLVFDKATDTELRGRVGEIIGLRRLRADLENKKQRGLTVASRYDGQ